MLFGYRNEHYVNQDNLVATPKKSTPRHLVCVSRLILQLMQYLLVNGLMNPILSSGIGIVEEVVFPEFWVE